ncbi:MAG TPA: PhoH family protein [Synergistaceae bacterium]|nr:PhoH family protein [Synergistaceae bacterium]
MPGEVQEKLLGQNDLTIQMVEERYPVHMTLRGETLVLRSPDAEPVRTVAKLLLELVKLVERGVRVTREEIRYGMDALAENGSVDLAGLHENTICFTGRGKPVRTRTLGQKRYMEAIQKNHVVFCIGPAGTGKTYLAVAQAVAMLKSQKVSRVILVRPAVEAGESLGYLPGDLKEKIEPYLRPLYDAFFDLLSPERFMRYVEKNVIEIAPLAYMRGRTLNDSFIILDEAQNTTPEQMKMFLTRMGFGSRVVITGDVTQVDLPSGKMSGLRSIQEILQGVEGIDFVSLTKNDVVRHEIVQKIVQAYEEFEKKQ